MYLAWEALSKFIPDLYIGPSSSFPYPFSLTESMYLSQIPWDMPLHFMSLRG